MKHLIAHKALIGTRALGEATAMFKVGRFWRKYLDCRVTLPCGREERSSRCRGARRRLFQTLIELKDVVLCVSPK